MRKIVPFLALFRQAFANLKTNDPIRMAGATAFFAFFALPPGVLIVSQVLSVLFNNYQQAVSGWLFGQLSDLLGSRGVRQLQDISTHLRPQEEDGWSIIPSMIILFIGATTLFEVMKNSLNQLWNVKAKANLTPFHSLQNRAIAIMIIIASGLLFTGSVALTRLLALPPAMTSETAMLLHGLTLTIGRHVISIVALTCWFALLFNYLPDVRVSWMAVWIGAVVTAVLFTVGEALLTLLLTDQQMQAVHGRAGAFSLVLLLVFYCSLIFYFGASFTRQYARWAELSAVPTKNAVGYQITEAEEPESKPVS